MTRIVWGLLAWLCLQGLAWAQAPVDAGQLLEQQRRLEQQQAAPVDPRAAPLRDATVPAAVQAAGDARVDVRRFLLQGNTLLDDAALQAVLQPWLARPATLNDLRQAAAAVEQRYRDAGWLAQVSLPPQDVTEGDVRLAVHEARMGRVQVTTAPDPAASAPVPRGVAPRLSARVQALIDARVAGGQPLNLESLQSALLIADELPGITVAGSLQAGTPSGSTDVLVQVASRPLLRGDVSVDNAANRSTGSERVNAALTFDAPLGFGEQFGLAASVTQGTEYLRASASLPVGTRGWRVGINGSALRYHVLDEFNTTTGLAPQGRGQTVGLDAHYPLWRSNAAHWDASLGIDQKQQTNDDDDLTPGQLQPTRQARSRSASAAVNGYAFDSFGRGGQTQANAQLAVGRLSLAGTPASQVSSDAQTENTQGSYGLLRWSAGRSQSLTRTLSIAATASGQFANRNLDSSEKIYLGGMGAVNAYPSGEAGGSAGQIVNLELRQQVAAGLQLSALYDWGQVRQYVDNERADGTGPLATPNSVTLQGAGVALDWHAAHGVHLRAVWAHRIGSNPLATANGNDSDGSLHRNRFWLSAGITF